MTTSLTFQNSPVFFSHFPLVLRTFLLPFNVHEYHDLSHFLQDRFLQDLSGTPFSQLRSTASGVLTSAIEEDTHSDVR